MSTNGSLPGPGLFPELTCYFSVIFGGMFSLFSSVIYKDFMSYPRKDTIHGFSLYYSERIQTNL